MLLRSSGPRLLFREIPIPMGTEAARWFAVLIIGRDVMIGFRSLGFLAAIGMLSMTSTFAHAKSCTEQGRECTAWAVGQYSSYKGACSTEVGACKARCKQGQKYFLGVLVGNLYPIDTCN
jgi:hypothetical protein